MAKVDPRKLIVGDIVKHHGSFYEITKLGDKVHLTQFTSAMVSIGGSLGFDSAQWTEVEMPRKADQRYISAVRLRQERLTPHMYHDAFRLPDGSVHVQNWISGMYGGMGQHHVHTAEGFAEWSKSIDSHYLSIGETETCCDLLPGQTREYDGTVWSA